MYKGIKILYLHKGIKYSMFPMLHRVRQGENVSPILFSLFLNDLENYLKSNNCNGVSMDVNDFDNFEVGVR